MGTKSAISNTFLKELLKYDHLPAKMINDLIELANDAPNNQVYGSKLYAKLMDLSNDRLIEALDVDRLYTLSVY